MAQLKLFINHIHKFNCVTSVLLGKKQQKSLKSSRLTHLVKIIIIDLIQWLIFVFDEGREL